MTNIKDIKLCDLAKYIGGITGIESDTVSAVDIWFIKFANRADIYRETKDGDKIPIDEAVLKISLTYDSAYAAETCMKKKHKNAPESKALEYEARVYEEVIKPLLDDNICPHFVRSFGRVKYCSYNQLLDMATKANISEENFRRNMSKIWGDMVSRPAINDNKKTKPNSIYPYVDEFKFQYLISERVEGPVYDEWIKEKHTDRELLYSIFQLLYTQYCMQVFGIAHNDLHFKNIFVVSSEPVDVRYMIGSKVYDFYNVRHILKVYDFDSAYTKKLGTNPNSFKKMDYREESWRDLFKIVCQFKKRKYDIKYLFGIDDKNISKTISKERSEYCWMTKDIENPRWDPESFIDRIYKLCGKQPRTLNVNYFEFKCPSLKRVHF